MSKALWTILLIVSGALALWRGTEGVIDLYGYLRLGEEVEAEVTHWEMVPKGSKTALEATYSYEYQGKTYEGKTLLSKPYYLNKKAANEAIESGKGMAWIASIDATKPQVSSIDNRFPFTSVFYGVCLVGIFLYFLFLKLYTDHISRSL